MAVAAIFTAFTAGAQVETQSATTTLSVDWTKPETPTVQSDNTLMLSGDSYINYTMIDKSPTSVTDNGTSYDNTAVRYIASIEVRGADGTVKAGPTYYRIIRDANGNITYQVATTRSESSVSLDLSDYELGTVSFSKYAAFVDEADARVWAMYGNYVETYYGYCYEGYYTLDNNQNQIYNYNWGTSASGNSIKGTFHVTDGADGDYLSMTIFTDNGDDNPGFNANRVIYGSTDKPGTYYYRGTPYYYYTSNNIYLYLVEPVDFYTIQNELSELSSTTTRYDIYDDQPLWKKDGEDLTSATAYQSNRMNAKSHSDEISVYVHRSMKKGTWTTLCLPFDISVANLKNENALGYDVKISEFQNIDLANDVVNFKSIDDNTTTLKAGKPYLIYYNGEDKSSFFAPHVTFNYTDASAQSTLTALSNRKSTATNDGYYYTGVLEPLTNDATVSTEQLGGGCIVYIATPGADGKQHLKKLKEGGKLKAFRAYLYYPKSGAANAAEGKGIISIDSELNDPTAITKVMVDGREVSNRIYNLQGQCVGAEPDKLPAGVYVRDGKKFVVK